MGGRATTDDFPLCSTTIIKIIPPSGREGRSRLAGISELMKRELEPSVWCRVSGRREGFTSQTETAGGAQESAKERDGENRRRDGREKPDQFIY